MKMYPDHDLYQKYKERLILSLFSKALPDVTKKATLENMNYAINLCDQWEHCMDIGGGTGHYLAALAAKFKRATLVEIQKHEEHNALVENFKNIELFNDYVEKYNTSIKPDFILMADLFEHIVDIKFFINQISTLQNTGGVVYIMTPNPIFCGAAPESGLYHTVNPWGHIKHYTKNEICSLMESAGYTLELALFEEGPFRQKAKHYLYALSRRDKKWNSYLMYSAVRPVFLLLVLPFFWIIEKLTYRSEKKYQYNELSTLTQDLVFKKSVTQLT